MVSLVPLLVYACSYDKIRVGGNYDGGYVIAANLTYDHCITAGIANDISFETGFLSLYPELSCESYDGTINKLPQSHPRINFHKENIGPRSFADQLNAHKNVFMKVDVESAEYPWIDSLSEDELKSIAQLVIEFHPGMLHQVDFSPLEKLTHTHTLVHFHGNVWGGLYDMDGVKIPRVFEATYIRKDLEPTTTLNTDTLPGPLDMSNARGRADIDLNYPPFVNK